MRTNSSTITVTNSNSTGSSIYVGEANISNITNVSFSEINIFE